MIILQRNSLKSLCNTWIIKKSNYERAFSCKISNNQTNKIRLFDQEYQTDEWTNINKNISEKLNRNLLHTRYHPLNHLANKIKHFFYKSYTNRSGTPLFSVYDNFKPVVSVESNFDK